MCVSCARASVYVTEVPSELLSAMGRGVAWRGVAWRGSGQNLLAGACGAQGLRRRLRRAWFMLHVADYRYSDKYTANVAGWHLPREAGAKRRWAKTQMGRMAVKS